MYIETSRMIIRDFTLEDATDLHDIFGDDETMENCEPAYDFEKTKEFLTSFCIGRKGAVAAVHKESGKMMGYILFNEFDENEPFDLFVLEEYRRKGYGRKLLAKALEMNQPNGMMLLVDADNEPAIRLYEFVGFAKVQGQNNLTAHWMVPEQL